MMKETCLTVDQLVYDAERCWVRYEQTLMSSESETFENFKGSLNLFYDKSGLFRSRTQIKRCLKLNFNTVNPMLLRKKSHFEKLIVLRTLENVFQCGLESALAIEHLNYLIIKEWQFVKKVLKQCYICKLIQGKYLLPRITPSLPSFRVNCCYPFETISVDYARPLHEITRDFSCESGFSNSTFYCTTR